MTSHQRQHLQAAWENKSTRRRPEELILIRSVLQLEEESPIATPVSPPERYWRTHRFPHASPATDKRLQLYDFGQRPNSGAFNRQRPPHTEASMNTKRYNQVNILSTQAKDVRCSSVVRTKARTIHDSNGSDIHKRPIQPRHSNVLLITNLIVTRPRPRPNGGFRSQGLESTSIALP